MTASDDKTEIDTETGRPAIRVNITLPPEVDEMLLARSKAERRSKSAHVAWLIERDAAQSAEPGNGWPFSQ